MKPVVSIIVPVYNMEARLARCVESLLAQDHSQLEILLVDDGSTDGSGSLCDAFARLDSRVTVLHQSNGGLSAARNAGMQLASGEYISFVDSDDWVESEFISGLVGSISGSDLAVCGVKIDYAHPASSHEVKPLVRDRVTLAASICALDEVGLLNYVWNKLYRRDIISRAGLRFQLDGAPGEDLLFNCAYLRHVSDIAILRRSLYHYMREGQLGLAGRYDPDLDKKVMQFNSERSSLYKFYSLTSMSDLRVNAYRFVENVQALVINECKAPDKSCTSVASRLDALRRDGEVRSQVMLYVPRSPMDRVFLFNYTALHPRLGALFYLSLLALRGRLPRVYSMLRLKFMYRGTA